MSWSGLANNQTVSFNNLQNAVATNVFVAGATIPTTNEQITKEDAQTRVYLDRDYAPFAAKANNQLVVKSDLQPACIIYLTVGGGYSGVYELRINVSVDQGTPAYGFEIAFDWCTDSGASGTAICTVNSNQTGFLQGVPINLSSTGDQSDSTAWGYQTINVDVASSNAVTAMYVKAPTLFFATDDPTCTYLLDYDSVDNACQNPAAVDSYCLYKCLD